MKQGIHPTWYPDAVVTCACGNTWTTGSTKKEIHTDVCNKCHPFFTGEQRIVDTAGQVERFMKRISAKEQIAAQQPGSEDKRSKKEKRRERHAPPSPAELPVAEVVETAPAIDAENVRANTPENTEILPPGEIANVASVDRVIEPETDESPRGSERALEGGTAEVTDRVADVEMPSAEKKPRARKPRGGERKDADEKPKTEESPKTEE